MRFKLDPLSPNGISQDTPPVQVVKQSNGYVSQGRDGQDGTDGVGVPEGGTSNQILAKNSNDDFDTEWVDAPIPVADDEAYGVTWNGSTEVPSKNAVYDKIETISAGSGISEELAIAYAVSL